MNIDPTRRLKSAIEAAEKTQPLRLLWSAPEAARALGVCPKTLWNFSEPRGTIPSLKIGTRTLYDPRDIKKWIDAQKRKGGAE